MTTKIEIISDAFILLGKGPINNIDNGPPIVDAMSKLFDLIYPTVICMHTWRFAMAFKTISPVLQTPPIDKWKYAYLLPYDLIKLCGTYPAGQSYARYENYIYSNSYPTLTLEYQFLPDINKWPYYFKNLMVVMLAGYAALTVTQDETIRQDYSEKALNYLVNARSIDSQQQPNPSIVTDHLLSRKFGG